ncbi:MAG: hypothetical protein WCS55_11740 [Sulfuricurvum sp.]|uniref:hypothetical protein n=1 Tax=Sulfuricurvum sp. TaxID=2025608 RepID=UPI0035641C4C
MKLLSEQGRVKGVEQIMKILLFNDNPVVRKLVALSAQKTKDDLSVIWSVDEIEESGYDLLIVDDALYSNEIFESLKEHITYKSTLLMATRGNAVPAGFDNVINKPFLPTDLVDMFIQIEKKIAGAASQPSFEPTDIPSIEPMAEEEPLYAINLEESLPDLNTEITDTFDAIDLDGLDENDSLVVGDLDDEIDLTGELNMDDLDDFDDHLPESAILDKEELQEVQGLLEETESDEWSPEEEISIPEVTEEAAPESFDEEIAIPDDFSDLLDMEEEAPRVEASSPVEEEDEFGDLELPEMIEETENTDDSEEMELNDADLDEALALMDEDAPLAEEEESLPSVEEEEEELRMDDDALDNLELQIQDAVNGLEPDVLESELDLDAGMELDEAILDDIALPDMSTDDETLAGFDELDMLDERELKLAVGEEVEEEEEIDIHAGISDHTSLSVEALDEAMDESSGIDDFIDEFGSDTEVKTGNSAEGVEAIQALLKALSNEEVAKSLKGLNISININFGNGA